MTAWISRIKLTNFKAYQNAEFNFPQPNANGGNLVLIGALNGHGKTTLLEALYLGLYGEKCVDILKRAVSYKDGKSPNDLLEDALSFKAKDDWKKALHNLNQAGKPSYQHKETGINIQIQIDIDYIDEQNTQNTLTVYRSWSFKYHDKKQDFVMMKDHDQRFQHTQNGVPKWIDNEEQFFEIFSAYVPNYNHSRFFLFDGEKLKDIGNKDAFIVGGLNDLIGVSLLDNEQEGKKGIKQALENRLNERLKQSKQQQEVQKEWQQKEQQAKNRSADIEQKQQQLDEIQEELQQLQSQQDDLRSQLSSRDTQSTDELLKEKENIERQKQEWENNIQAALKQLPLYLLPKTEFSAFARNIKKEFERIKLENNRLRLEPNLTKFNDKFFEEIEQTKGETVAQMLVPLKTPIEEAIKTAWHSLYYPLSDNEAEYVRHNYLSETNHQDIATTIDIRKKQGLPEIQQQLQQSENASKRLSEIDEELNTAKIENRDELLKQFKQIDEEINKSQHQQGALSNEITRLNSELQTLNAEIQTIRKKLAADGDLETEKLQRLINAIDLLRERLIVQKQQDLQNNTLKVYQRISHDERVRSVYIAEQKIAFLDSNNNELADGNFSAGERQLQLTALTLALSKTTGFIAPMVIDTPLARLDENNREKLLNYLSSLPQQVILLTQSGEINRNQCDEMFAKNQVSKTYLVQSKDYGEGRIATVSENQYFIKE